TAGDRLPPPVAWVSSSAGTHSDASNRAILLDFVPSRPSSQQDTLGIDTKLHGLFIMATTSTTKPKLPQLATPVTATFPSHISGHSPLSAKPKSADPTKTPISPPLA